MELDAGLIGHWPLAGDPHDRSAAGHATTAVDVDFGAVGRDGKAGGAAGFNGRSSMLEVADHPALRFGTGELTIAAWVYTDGRDADVVGNIVSKFDDRTRKGVQLYIVTHSGVTSAAQSNYRHLHFGIDDGRLDDGWQDCGRPGNAAFVTALTASGGLLYAGTAEYGPDQVGRLHVYDGGRKWVDLGNPVGCNAIHSVVEFDGSIYCGTSRYAWAGSAMGETLNRTPGGKVYRLDEGGDWSYCGHPGHEDATPDDRPVGGSDTGKADDVMALTVYRGELYCVSNHRRGVFKYEGGTDWRYIGPELRIMTLPIYRGKLYALINGGPVLRYEGGCDWADCGHPEGSTQTYSSVIHYGRMYVGTWPEGQVQRYDGDRSWSNLGRAAYEREIMGMALYNGKVYLGGLPMANVYRMDGDGFVNVGNLDSSPVGLRRVWSMVVYDGRLYAGTLPSGHVRSIEAGKMATWDQAFPAGWHHIAAVKGARRLRLYVDGQPAACSRAFHPGYYDLSNERPLRIGFGAFEHFDGAMSDVRIYSRALAEAELGRLCRSS